MRSAIAQPVAASIPEKPITFTAFSIRQTLAGRKTVTRRIVNLEHLKVRLPYRVKSDLPAIIAPRSSLPGPRSAALNPQGAVSVRTDDGELLGVKPGEFDFICPYVTGTTRLVDGGWRIEPHGEQRLWCRETWSPDHKNVYPMIRVVYRADAGAPSGSDIREHVSGCKAENGGPPYFECLKCAGFRWRSPRFMPRLAARLFLKVHEVRIERLGDISDRDLDAEGMRVNDVAADLGVDWSSIPDQRSAFRLAWNRMHGAGAFEADPFVWVITYSVVQQGAINGR